MCGIAGFNWNDKALGIKMALSLKHRGPDGSGIFSDKYITLSHRRLAIIDLSVNASQPMKDKRTGNVIIFNGEIYNFKSIAAELEEKGYKFTSNSDTEVLLKAYSEYGINFLEKVDGMFAFCIYDAKKKKLILARDRLGEKPLYYYFDGKRFIFASEIKAILKHDIKREINLSSLRAYLKYRYIPGEDSIFKDIKKLPAGHYIEFLLRSRKIKKTKYWDLKENIQDEPERVLKEQVLETLKASVRNRLVSDRPLGVYLSGGVDSSAIVALMREISSEAKIKTFTVGFNTEFDELKKAKEVSKLFRTKHKEFIVRPDLAKTLPKIMKMHDEPIMDPASIPLYHLSKYAKKDVAVVLLGDGGDEVFAGYDHYRFLMLREKIKRIPFKSVLVSIVKLVPKQILKKRYKYLDRYGDKAFERIRKLFTAKNNAEAYDALMSVFSDEELDRLLKRKKHTEMPKMSAKMKPLTQYQYYDIKNLLPEYFLMKTDRALMAHGVEGRVPFLYHRLVELGFRIPSQMKIGKHILKKVLHEKGLLPKDILYKSKQAFFLPIDEWLDKGLMKEFKRLLNKKRIEQQGLFNYDEIKRIFDEYHKSKLYYAKQLWALACFQYWYKSFMEEKK